MWQIVRAEISYARIGIVITAGVCLFFFILSAAGDQWNFGQYATNTAFVFVVALALTGSKSGKQLRHRLYATLPLSATTVGLARLASLFVLLGGVVALWLVFLLVRPMEFEKRLVWYMITFAAIIVSVINLFTIQHDFRHFRDRRYRRVGYAIALLAAGLFIVFAESGVLGSIHDDRVKLFQNPAASFFYVVLCALLSWTSVRVFVRRHSYLR